MAFEHYMVQNGARLRLGFTTGTCATLAAKAAARILLGQSVTHETVQTPKGLTVTAPILAVSKTETTVRCGVQKDGGDDIDATHGAMIFATVERMDHGLAILGGQGVGRVTRPGLNQPAGEAAINSGPRRQIAEALAPLSEHTGFRVTIDVPGGETLAQKTFNPQLGIEGGISILGTTGIVEPRSLKALLDSIAVELRVHGAAGVKSLILTPGNYGETFLSTYPHLAAMPQVKCANFVGDTLDLAAQSGIETILLVGHIGKMVKLAGGIMDTHSRVADCRTELFAVHAALCGASRETVQQLMDAATSDGCIALLDDANLRTPVLDAITLQAQRHLSRRGGNTKVGLVTFSNQYGLLTVSAQAQEILNDWSMNL